MTKRLTASWSTLAPLQRSAAPVVLAAAVLVTSAAFLRGAHLDPADYIPLHTALELFSIVVCGMVFVIVWNMRETAAEIAVATAFLATAVFTLFHLFDYAASTSGHADVHDRGVAFWLAARSSAAVGLAIAAYRPWYVGPDGRRDSLPLLLIIVATLAIAVVVLRRTELIPAFFDSATGLTPTKVGIEWLLAAIFALAAGVTLWRGAAATTRASLFTACGLAAVGELYFALYRGPHEVILLAGHFFVGWSYYFMYRSQAAGRLQASQHLLTNLASRVDDLQVRWRQALEAGQHGVIEVDVLAGRIMLSSGYMALLGFAGSPSTAVLDAEEFGRRLHPEDRSGILEQLKGHPLASADDTSIQFVYRMRTNAGGYIWLDGRLAVVSRDADGKPLRMLGTVTDVTERHELEAKLQQALADLRAYASREEQRVEEERQRIAGALHDEMGQYLAVLAMESRQLHAKVGGAPESDEILNRIDDLLGGTRDAMRRVVADLRPVALDAGLASAIGHYARNFGARAGIEIECVTLGDGDAIPAPTQIALFRVLQEALTNVIQHARATSVHVALAVTPTEATLTIADDGKGLSPEQRRRPGHYGLFGIEERMRSIGGRLTIESAPGRGTELTVTVPLPETGPVLQPHAEEEPAP